MAQGEAVRAAYMTRGSRAIYDQFTGNNKLRALVSLNCCRKLEELGLRQGGPCSTPPAGRARGSGRCSIAAGR